MRRTKSKVRELWRGAPGGSSSGRGVPGWVVGSGGALAAGAGVTVSTVLARASWAQRVRRQAGGDGVRVDDGVELRVRTDGRADAEVSVVLVHGFAARATELEPQRAVLGRTCRTVSYDQRGHGDSGWGGRRSATLDRLGRDLATVIERCTSGPIVLVGHSMGGMAVMALASQRPALVRERVVGAALLSTSAGRMAKATLPRPAAELVRHSRAERVLGFFAWFAAPLAEIWQPFGRPRVRRWVSARLFGPEGADRATTEAVIDMWQSTRRSITASFYPALVEHDRIGSLSALRGMPVLVLTGTHDAMIPAEHSHEIAEVIGGRARLVEVPLAGHMVNLTHSDQTNEALLDLLDRVRSYRPDLVESRVGED